VKPWVTLARALGPGHQELVLRSRDGVFTVHAGGHELMSSARPQSEEAMARVGLAGLAEPSPRVLIGGLGLGFTLRATLELLPPGGTVQVAEISAAIVEWNRTLLGDDARRPLEDPRTQLSVADVLTVVRESKGRFDCLLLDVDNGPRAMVAQSNQELYAPRGLRAMKAALRPGGRLVLWSAGPDAAFVRRLVDTGFDARVVRSAAHVFFVAQVSASRPRASRRTS
jgi:spermidine synthase